MSLITRFINSVSEPQFILARDLVALAIADGEITEDERQAISRICNLEGVNESDFYNSMQQGNGPESVKIPQNRKEKEEYMKKLILLIGADEYCSAEEAYLFQIVAGKMGLTQMDVVGLFLSTATHANFKGDAGAKVLSTFLRNYIDPIGRTISQNREGVRRMYETVAMNTLPTGNHGEYNQLLEESIKKTTQALAENRILMDGFKRIGTDFSRLLAEEERYVLRRFKR